MTYKPLSDVRETLKVSWYRSAMPPARFRELSRRSDRKGWVQAGGHLGLFVLTGLMVWYFWSQQMWIAFACACFAHGTIGSFFRGTSVHELGHGTVFETRWLNDLFLYTFSMLSWWNPFDYALSHTYHHRYTLHPEGDREVLLPIHPNVGATFLLQMFTLNIWTQPGRTFSKGGILSTLWLTWLDAIGRNPDASIPANEWLTALHSDQPDEARKSMWWSRVQLAFHGGILLIAIVTGLWVLPFIFTLCSYMANWLSYFLGLTQHCGLMSNTTDFRKSTRSIRLPRALEFLYWHMNWHTEHHMYAGIPCYNLPKLAAEIRADMPEPRTLGDAWREMLDTWDRQKADPDYGFDTALPATAETQRTRNADREESSIGDLAPSGLA